MMPVLAVICRILNLSETKIFPDLSTAILEGDRREAEVALIPPTVVSAPAPATVVMMPVLTVIFLINPPLTVMNMFPALSSAMPPGTVKNALVARMPSSVPPAGNPPPATVLMMPVLAVIFLILPFVVSAM